MRDSIKAVQIIPVEKILKRKSIAISSDNEPKEKNMETPKPKRKNKK
jgi:hypothetical protein